MTESKASKRRRHAPLRKIVGSFQNEVGTTIERLECGHLQHRLVDAYGPTNAGRRRCMKCQRVYQVAAEAIDEYKNAAQAQTEPIRGQVTTDPEVKK